LADISAATNAHKQSAVTFEVFILWLHNQRYYIHDVIGIKMMCRDLPYYEGIRAKTRREYKLHKNKHKNHTNSYIPLEMVHNFVVSGRSKRWLIRHSMASTAIYSSHDCGVIKHGGLSLDSQSLFFVASYQVSLCCYSGYLTFLL